MKTTPLKFSANSDLNKRVWAVIAVHYISCDLTHSEALAEAADLRRRKQPGVSIVTNDVAQRMMESQQLTSRAAA